MWGELPGLLDSNAHFDHLLGHYHLLKSNLKKIKNNLQANADTNNAVTLKCSTRTNLM